MKFNPVKPGYTHGNTKPHLFGEDGWCLCHKYFQDVS